MINPISHKILCVAFACFLLAGITIVPFNDAAQAATDCPIDISEPSDIFNLTLNGQITFSTFSVNTNNTASITVTNNTPCSLPLTLASYEVYNQNVGDQKLYNYHNTVVASSTSQLLYVDLPSCMSQIDLLHDPNRDGPPTPPSAANPKLIGWTFQLNNNDIAEENDIFHFSADNPYNELDRFPNDDDDGYSTVPEENRCTDNPPLTLNCTTSPGEPAVNEPVTWEAVNVSGGSGNYTYEWSGDVTGNNRKETEVYSKPGEKTGVVTVTSGEQQRSAECEIAVSDDDGGGDDGSFSIGNTNKTIWTVAESSLSSTKTTLDISASNGFSEPVTIEAEGASIANNETMFIHNGNNPQETLTLSPDQFNDSIKFFVNTSVLPGTYPMMIIGESADGQTATSSVFLRAQTYAEL